MIELLSLLCFFVLDCGVLLLLILDAHILSEFICSANTLSLSRIGLVMGVTFLLFGCMHQQQFQIAFFMLPLATPVPIRLYLACGSNPQYRVDAKLMRWLKLGTLFSVVAWIVFGLPWAIVYIRSSLH